MPSISVSTSSDREVAEPLRVRQPGEFLLKAFIRDSFIEKG